MNRSELRKLLQEVARGEVTVDDAVGRVGTEPFEDLGYAKPDLHRGIRTGASEVIYGAGKSAAQIAGIVKALLAGGQQHVLVTRVDGQKASDAVSMLRADGYPDIDTEFYGDAHILMLGEMPEPDGNGFVVVACAGTSDLYCAEEAALTAEAMGSRVERLYDVGVAGIHRLLAHVELLQRASAIVAVAGMEGALASVVGGLCACPVIACPTSVGYGASLGGISALLAMLNSCSSGTSVVNIDNGFGAGFQAALIDHARVTRE
ncbi:MAG: nickel pincer cofactor biosynthesis protein LarB [Atopobiaceae bacterium]|nr:nickel pincer cofactor biosynthesis protein LarB [Atopobiaceae bacterium]